MKLSTFTGKKWSIFSILLLKQNYIFWRWEDTLWALQMLSWWTPELDLIVTDTQQQSPRFGILLASSEICPHILSRPYKGIKCMTTQCVPDGSMWVVLKTLSTISTATGDSSDPDLLAWAALKLFQWPYGRPSWVDFRWNCPNYNW